MRGKKAIAVPWQLGQVTVGVQVKQIIVVSCAVECHPHNNDSVEPKRDIWLAAAEQGTKKTWPLPLNWPSILQPDSGFDLKLVWRHELQHQRSCMAAFPH